MTFLADANSLDHNLGGLGNVYLNGKTRENTGDKFGPEFGSTLYGKIGILSKDYMG